MRNIFLILCMSVIFVQCKKKEEPVPSPVAGFNYSPKTGLVAPITISFVNTSKNATSYLWKVNGKDFDTDEDIGITFNKSGAYLITLEATGEGGKNSHSLTVVIQEPITTPDKPENSTKPTARFSYTPGENLQAPVSVNFKNESLNATSYNWLVTGNGDKVTVLEKDFNYKFEAAGSYSIKLVAIGPGGTDEIIKSLTIGNPPVTFVPPGKVIFWATSGAWDKIDLELSSSTYQQAQGSAYFGAAQFGSINKSANSAPACGTIGFFTNERGVPGTVGGLHTYKATIYKNAKVVGEKNGTFIVEANKCTSVQIVTPTQSGPDDGNPGGPPAGSPPSTTFLVDRGTFANQTSTWTQQFEVTGSTRFLFRLSAQYNMQAGIFPVSQLSAFTNRQPVSGGQAVFDNNFGTQTVTLTTGKYFLGLRNNVNGSNAYSFELDKDISLPAPAVRVQLESKVESVNRGGYYYYSFMTSTSQRYFIDGCNTGLDVYLTDEANFNKFKNNQQFQYFTGDFSGENNTAMPGFAEIPNTGKTYYLIFSNRRGSEKHGFTYTWEAWK